MAISCSHSIAYCSVLMQFQKYFCFFKVNTNGVISFINEVRSYSPNPFPLAGQLRMIAALWTDIDTSRNGGRAYFRETTDADLLQRATNDVRSAFGALTQFTATWVFVATWHKVTYYGGSSSTPVSLCLFFYYLYTPGPSGF